MNDRLLAVDDSPETLNVLRDVLGASGYKVDTALSLAALRERLAREAPDVVLLDWRLPDGDGIGVIPEVKQHWPETEVIVLTGYGTFDAAVEATKRGAFHFVSKPFEIDVLLSLVKRACEYKRAQERSDRLQRILADLGTGESPVFRSNVMKALFRQAERAAQSDGPVLITGEGGTGKEVFARLIHALGPRTRQPWLRVPCATLPEEVTERELFGMARGASGAALADYDGLLKRAGAGTILLDQITLWPQAVQKKLAAVMKDGRWIPLGGDHAQMLECRVIAMMREPVEAGVLENRVNEDFLRLVGPFILRMPALRERREDIPALAENALRRFAAQAESSLTGFSPAAMAALVSYDWPGHVRQLENEILTLALNVKGEFIEVEHLPVAIRSKAPRSGFDPRSWMGNWGGSTTAPKQAGFKARLKREGA